MIQVNETFMEGKKSAQLCEDALFVSNDFVAVIDGVTAKSDFTYNGKTTGKLAAEIIRDTFAAVRRDAGIRQILRCINTRIQDFYQTVPFPYDRRQQGLQAACVIYSDYFRSIWMIGDCQASIDGKPYWNPKKNDVILSEMRSLILHIREAEGQDWDLAQKEGRSQIEPWILQSNIFANRADTPYGYAVLNGEEIPDSLIRTISLDEKPHKVIFTSDGYPDVKETLELSENHLKMLLEQDPACYKLYRSTKGLQQGQKSFDDRTYIAFRVLEDCGSVSHNNEEKEKTK